MHQPTLLSLARRLNWVSVVVKLDELVESDLERTQGSVWSGSLHIHSLNGDSLVRRSNRNVDRLVVHRVCSGVSGQCSASLDTVDHNSNVWIDNTNLLQVDEVLGLADVEANNTKWLCVAHGAWHVGHGNRTPVTGQSDLSQTLGQRKPFISNVGCINDIGKFESCRANQLLGRVSENDSNLAFGPVVDDLVVCKVPGSLLALLDQSRSELEFFVDQHLGKHVSWLFVVLVVCSGSEQFQNNNTSVKVWRWRVRSIWQLESLQSLHQLQIDRNLACFSVVSQNWQVDISDFSLEHDLFQIVKNASHHLVLSAVTLVLVVQGDVQWLRRRLEHNVNLLVPDRIHGVWNNLGLGQNLATETECKIRIDSVVESVCCFETLGVFDVDLQDTQGTVQTVTVQQLFKIKLERQRIEHHWAGEFLDKLVDGHEQTRNVKNLKRENGVSAKRFGNEVKVRSLHQGDVDCLDVRELGLDNNALVDVVLQLFGGGVFQSVRVQRDPPVHHGDIVISTVQSTHLVNSWSFGTQSECMDPNLFDKSRNWQTSHDRIGLVTDHLRSGWLNKPPVTVQKHVQPVHRLEIIFNMIHRKFSLCLESDGHSVLSDGRPSPFKQLDLVADADRVSVLDLHGIHTKIRLERVAHVDSAEFRQRPRNRVFAMHLTFFKVDVWYHAAGTFRRDDPLASVDGESVPVVGVEGPFWTLDQDIRTEMRRTGLEVWPEPFHQPLVQIVDIRL
ncbi:hypothetical protein OGAPHI_002154 [Ogataea philodendri]|uniref:Uncharacterized protein n=1 Tax=Ogataea philodendri TaxID=1378263 RepID=A0A9P8PAX2_9ASCO|nr:uncharacterized protein OGAPHI_002154 [Ogataea philodendri]KAH3668400.1 hypothetical protein OGAPHI_002154 [Ogataea philodendri]